MLRLEYKKKECHIVDIALQHEDARQKINTFPIFLRVIAIDRSIAKALWVDRTAFKKIKFKKIFKKVGASLSSILTMTFLFFILF